MDLLIDYFSMSCRCLGIPNTAHFANVTQIEDAMSLWEKLKVQKQEEAWKPEMVSGVNGLMELFND